MDTDAINAARYLKLRAYAQSVRDWFLAHPDHKPGDVLPNGETRPWFCCGVIIALSGEELDRECDERAAE